MKHNFVEIMTVAILATLTGKSSCNVFSLFAWFKLDFPRELKPLEDAQVVVDDKSNETSVMPSTIEILDRAGRTAVADACRLALNIARLENGRNSLEGWMHIASVSDEYLIRLLLNAGRKF